MKKEHVEGNSFFHQSIIDKLNAGWDIKINGDSFIPSSVVRENTPDDVVIFDSHVNFDGAWVKLATVVKRQDPVVTYYAMLGYGRSSITSPLIIRQNVVIDVDGKFTIQLDELLTTAVLHGQATPPRRFSYDFADASDRPGMSVSWMIDEAPKPMEPTDYAPSYPQQTGGNWLYMGVNHHVSDKNLAYWRSQLLALANMPGHLVHDSGEIVREKDYPDAVLAGGQYFHRDAPGYILYSDSKNPWRDRSHYDTDGKDRWSCPDGQHLSHYDALCEAWMQWPEAEDLRWLILFAAARYNMQFPGKDKGTWRWDPGQARERGRILKTGVKLYRALKQMGEDDLAGDVGVRVGERLQNQIDEFRAAVTAGKSPWPMFSKHPGYAPHEMGIWWWGLDQVDDILEEYGIDNAEVNYMKARISKFCFDSFREWPDLPGDRGWAVPYYVRPDGTDSGSPSSGAHFCWLAAIDHVTSDTRKLEGIIDLGKDIPERFKG